jgi:hypothetical protein
LRLEPVVPVNLSNLPGLLALLNVRRYLCDDTVLARTQAVELMQEAAARIAAGFRARAYGLSAFAGAVEPLVALVDETNTRSRASGVGWL